MYYTIHLRSFVVLSVALLFTRDVNAGQFDRRILPTEVEVQEGEDVQIRLVKSLGDGATCYARTPLLVNCNLKLAGEGNVTCDERVHYWSVNGACGFYITNVNKQDDGNWRLTSQNDRERVVDIVTITVLDKFSLSHESVEITKGHLYELMFSDVREYCIVCIRYKVFAGGYITGSVNEIRWQIDSKNCADPSFRDHLMHGTYQVQNPHNPSYIVAKNKCSVEIQQVSAVDQGNWHAIVGVRGQMQEVVKRINVTVFYEHVQFGYNVSSDSIHIYCKYIAIKKSLSFCRFAKSAISQIGLRLREGVRKGRYEYYGDGLDAGECGLTIRSPKENDYGPWYCLLSPTDDKSVTPIVTVVDVLKPASYDEESEESYNKREVTPARTSAASPVITATNQSLTLQCFSTKPLNYCWFSMPNGEVYTNYNYNDTNYIAENNNGNRGEATLSNMLQEEKYWFGRCEIVIEKAKSEHNGTWTCHMGPASPGIESIEQINVRVANSSLAAVKQFVSLDDKKMILHCKTVPHVMALSYCRFKSPSGFGISMDQSVTESNPIVHDNVRYWYYGDSLRAGDCGLVIKPVSAEHNGNWTCAALIELDANKESFDIIHYSYSRKPISGVNTSVNTDGDSAVTIVSVVFGSLGLIITMGIITMLGIKYKEKFRNRWLKQSRVNSMQK